MPRVAQAAGPSSSSLHGCSTYAGSAAEVAAAVAAAARLAHRLLPADGRHGVAQLFLETFIGTSAGVAGRCGQGAGGLSVAWAVPGPPRAAVVARMLLTIRDFVTD